MLGFEKDKEVKAREDREIIKQYLQFKHRLDNNCLTKEDEQYLLAREMFENSTPGIEITWDDNDNNISNFCRVCNFYRDDKTCNGKKFKCEKFENRYDNYQFQVIKDDNVISSYNNYKQARHAISEIEGAYLNIIR